jgi:hypothetical protein
MAVTVIPLEVAVLRDSVTPLIEFEINVTVPTYLVTHSAVLAYCVYCNVGFHNDVNCLKCQNSWVEKACKEVIEKISTYSLCQSISIARCFGFC